LPAPRSKEGWMDRISPARPAPSGQIELVFAPDPTVHDGRFANNGWLQELPKPITKLTWDNAALISPATAEKLGVKMRSGQWKGGEHGETIADVISIKHGKRLLKDVPVWIQPGHADDVITLTLGYGRKRAGKVARGQGHDANRLRLSTAPHFLVGVE